MLIPRNEELALKLLSVETFDGALLESVILQDYGREHALFEEIDSHDASIGALLLNIIKNDEELLMQNIVKSIKEQHSEYSLDVIRFELI